MRRGRGRKSAQSVRAQMVIPALESGARAAAVDPFVDRALEHGERQRAVVEHGDVEAADVEALAEARTSPCRAAR